MPKVTVVSTREVVKEVPATVPFAREEPPREETISTLKLSVGLPVLFNFSLTPVIVEFAFNLKPCASA